MNKLFFLLALPFALDIFTRRRNSLPKTATHASDLAQSDLAQNDLAQDETSPDETPSPNSLHAARDARDKLLVEQCRNGDANAFDEIVARHQDAIYTLCFYHLRDADDAADAAQTTFVRAWRGLKNFRGESALRTWLHRIALNVVNDVGAKRSKTPVSMSSLKSSSDDDDDALPEAVDHAPSPEARLNSQMQRRAVQNALAQLSPHHRDVLVLFDVQGHSYEEVAAVLELPLGTVKSRLSRARLALRAALEECRELFDL